MTPEEVETHHESHRTGHRWVDWSVTGCALFVSFCSLALSIHHGDTMEQLVQANSLPFLQFSYSNAERLPDGSFGGMLTLEVENVGAGPARIDWMRTTFAGERVVDWDETLEALQRQAIASGQVAAEAPVGAVIKGTFTSTFLKGSDKRQLLRWARTEANASFWKIAQLRIGNISELEQQACYCSIFEQCWIASNRSFKPRSVESCARKD